MSATDYACPRCDSQWGGTKTCHCSSCHETFATIAAFDKHRAGSHALSTRHCEDPATVGLKDAARPYRCWSIDKPDDPHPMARR